VVIAEHGCGVRGDAWGSRPVTLDSPGSTRSRLLLVPHRKDLLLTDPLLLRPVEAARLLGISRSKLYELLAAGELPVIHIGRSARIPLTSLRAWVEAQLPAGV
jgi:excisionase family DNA binding protein